MLLYFLSFHHIDVDIGCEKLAADVPEDHAARYRTNHLGSFIMLHHSISNQNILTKKKTLSSNEVWSQQF